MPGRLTSPDPNAPDPSGYRSPGGAGGGAGGGSDGWRPNPYRINGIIRWRPRNAGHSVSGSQYSATPIDRKVSISASALLNKLPLVYAEAGEPIRLQGLLSFVFDYSPLKFLGVIASFAHGPLESLSGFEINGIPIADCSFVNTYDSDVGGFSKTAYSFFADSLSAYNFTEGYQGIADLGILFQTDDPNMPTSLSITALCGGRIITDYRTAGTGASANPALCMYDVLTLPEIGMGIDTALVDTGVGSSWRQKADWHDTVMSDSTKRYHFIGAMTADPWIIIDEIGKHGFVEIDSNGSQYTLFGWDNPSPVVDAFTVGLDDVSEPLKWREIPEQRRPNALNVNYKVGETGEPAYYPAEVSGIDAETIRPQSISYAGCRSRSVAKRLGTKLLNIALQELHEWNGDVRAEAMEGTERGDLGILTTHDGIADGMRVRLIDKGQPLNGWVNCTFCQYGATTDSEDVEDEIDVIPPNPAQPPPVPSTYTETIRYGGPWSNNSLTGTDGDNLTTLWTNINSSFAYNGTEEATIMSVNPAFTSGYIFEDITVPTIAESLKLTVSLKFWDNVEYDGTNVFIQLYDTGTTSVVWSRQVTPPDDRYVTAAWDVQLNTLTQTPDRMRIFFARSTGLPSEPEIAIKRVFVVPAGALIADSNLYNIIGEHEWVIPSDPYELIKGFRAVKNTVNGIETVKNLDEEETVYQYPIIYGNLPQTVIEPDGNTKAGDIISASQPNISIVSSYLIIMQSVGVSLVSKFPAPTQTFSEESAPPSGTIVETSYTQYDNMNRQYKWREYVWTPPIGADAYIIQIFYQLSVGGEYVLWSSGASDSGSLIIGATRPGEPDAERALPIGTIYNRKIYLTNRYSGWYTEWSYFTASSTGTPLSLSQYDVLYYDTTAVDWIAGQINDDIPNVETEYDVTIDSSHILNLPVYGSNFRVFNYAAASSDYINNITGGVEGRIVKLRAGSASQLFVLYDRDTVGTSTVVLMGGPQYFKTLRESVTLQYTSQLRWVEISHGKSTEWDDSRFVFYRAAGSGTYPSLTKIADDGSGSIGVYTEEFPSNVNRHIGMRTQLSHRYYPGSNLYPHIHFYCQASDTGTKYIVWEMEYIFASSGGTLPANSTVISVTYQIDNPVARKEYIAALPTITGTSATESTIIHARVARLGTDGSDTLGDVWLGDVDAHIEENKLGTRIEYV